MADAPPPLPNDQPDGGSATCPAGLHQLIEQCSFMKKAYLSAGAPLPRTRPDGFATLIRIIVDQQVSVHAGRAIWRKLETGLGTVTPKTVLEASDDTLRGGGLSRPKVRYSRALAHEVVENGLDLEALRSADDVTVMASLTRVTGIGRWTAEIYLMFALGRPDVWPAGDLALAVSAQRLMQLETRPTPKEMDEIAERWRPWRSTAALMLWYYYRFTGGPGAPGD